MAELKKIRKVVGVELSDLSSTDWHVLDYALSQLGDAKTKLTWMPVTVEEERSFYRLHDLVLEALRGDWADE